MKRPLAPVAILYSCGVLLAHYLGLSVTWLFVGLGALTLMALYWARARPFLLIPLLVLAGGTNLTWRTTILSPNDLRTRMGDQPALVTLHGLLLETPTERVYLRRREPVWRTLVLMEAQALKRGTNNQSAFGRVLVTSPGRLEGDLHAGIGVEITGVLRRPKTAAAEGLFNYRTFLEWQGIYYQLETTGAGDWQKDAGRIRAATPPFAERFSRWAQTTLGRGMPGEDESLRLIWAMALGWKTALTDEVSAPFMQTGTMHIFAISGLHIALIAGILVSVLRVLRIPRGACGLLVIPAIWFYTAATGWQASAIRSAIMMTVVIAGWSLRRPGDLLNSLSASGFLILLWDPGQLFQASFQLSFFVVLSLGLLHPHFDRLRRQWLQTDPLLPDALRPRWRKWLDRPVHYLTAGLATSLAAWIGSLPLIAYYFHMVTPVSLLANLVIVPLSSVTLVCNLGSLLCGPWLTSCTVLFNHSAWLWMELAIRFCDWAAGLPGAFFYVRPPTLIEFLLFYGAAFAILTGWLFRSSRKTWMVSILGVLAVLCLGQCWTRGKSTRITILSLGGGDAIFVDGRGVKNPWEIDAGNESAAAFITIPFLRAQGVNRLDHLLLTHGDQQHIGGTELLEQECHVRQLLFSSVPSRSPVYRRITQNGARSPEPGTRINRGDSIGPWTVLHPQADDRFSRADDSALVLRGVFDGIRLLLLSDLGRLGQQALLEREPGLRADIVIAGLPGQGEPLADALLDGLQPQLIVLSTSEQRTNERPTPALRTRLENRGIPVVETGRDGSVTLELAKGRWSLRTMNGRKLASPTLEGNGTRSQSVAGPGALSTPH